ncbi:putative MFS-type transporter [Candidatus Syntrophocurvum alkaliphilum]|uniref:Putative MFS-type transporter n=1 Tax=Candidatus Syntrophocurvum alkaliphilum TaxID=2293317 RepID=A0A6I6DG65_9FIRM|nr:MFS transporter [Candidatus Syntrophocurvum alkaliphilum]QGT99400.1 putative MFS-type transporter [Candidatus Syntrophocurvum alkaliphilum]
MIYILVYFIVIVSFIDTMAQLPILSPYVYSLGATSIVVGLIMGAYSLFNMIGNLGAGLIIDRYGRKIAIISGMIIAGSAVSLYAFVASPFQLLILRIIHGLGGAILIPAAFAYVGDRVGQGSTGRAMGYSGAAVGFAALIGPMFAGMGKDAFGFSVVFLSLGLLLIKTSIIAWLFLPETYSLESKNKVFTKEIILNLITNTKLQIAYLAAFSLMFTMGILAYAFPITLESLNFASKDTGILFSIFSIVAIIIFILPISKWSDKNGRYLPIAIGLFLVTLALLLLPLGNTFSQFVFMMILYGCGFGFIFPAMTSIVVDETKDYFRGTAFGIFYAFFSFGVMSGPVIGGIASEIGQEPFWIGALIIILIQMILYKLHIKVTN